MAHRQAVNYIIALNARRLRAHGTGIWYPHFETSLALNVKVYVRSTAK
jgi:hypothetical protein